MNDNNLFFKLKLFYIFSPLINQRFIFNMLLLQAILGSGNIVINFEKNLYKGNKN